MRENKVFKAFTWFLSFVFLLEQSGFASDRIFEKAEYSVVKALLPDGRETQRMESMAPSYLLRSQKKHEAIIRSKNLVDEGLVYVLDHGRAMTEDANISLKKRKGDSSKPNRVEYTLSDYDDKDAPQMISVYNYATNSDALRSIVSYDIRRQANIWNKSGLENVAAEDADKMMASFDKGNYVSLTDKIEVTETYYFGDQGKEKIDYVLSDFRKGKANEVSIYVYDDARTTIKEVNTYDISKIAAAYKKDDKIDEWRDYIKFRNTEWREDAQTNGKLKVKSVYEGISGEERAVYTLSEYNAGVVPGKIDCYDRSGGANNGELTNVRTYNIKGVDLAGCLDDLRKDKREYDNILTSKSYYKGKRDRERIDYVMSGYYNDSGEYKPALRTNYVYSSKNGRMERTETYGIKNGGNVLRQCTEFTGLKGHENVSLSYDYEIDGKTLYSVSAYDYEAPVDEGSAQLGGDGDSYTLDRVIKYVGTENPHDLTSAKVKSETYYDGMESKEYAVYTYGFDIRTGDIITRTEYEYDGDALSGMKTFRLLDAAMSYTLGSGAMVSSLEYIGEKDYEKVKTSATYDLAGTILSTTGYEYASNGALTRTVTADNVGRTSSVTTYEGPEKYEKRSLATNYDLTGGVISTTRYGYTVVDSLEKTFSYDALGAKMSETSYRGVPGDEKISGTTVFDRLGSAVGSTKYNYDFGCVLTRTITSDENGNYISETLYEGPENYEKTVSSATFDLAGEKLIDTSYSYDATGALRTTVSVNSEGLKLSETSHAGLMGSERADVITSFDLKGGKLSENRYFYADSGAIDRTETWGYSDETRSLLMKLSHMAYEGVMGQEKTSLSEAFDLAGEVISRTQYVYSDRGSLVRTVTTDPDGVEVSRMWYSGSRGREKTNYTETLDMKSALLTTNRYYFNDDGSIKKVVVTDSNGNKLSETAYIGRMDRESVDSVTSCDASGDMLTVTKYTYDDSGATDKTVTKWLKEGTSQGWVTASETEYSGLMGRERVVRSRSMDLAGDLLTVSAYVYNDNGSIKSTVTLDENGDKLSESVYEGKMSRERVSAVKSYDLIGDLLTVTAYVYKADGAIASTVTSGAAGEKISESVYQGRMSRERVLENKSYDLSGGLLSVTAYAYKSDGAVDLTTTRDDAGKKLSQSVYAGRMSREKVEDVISFDQAGEILSETAYEYKADGAIAGTLTKDDAGNKLSQSVYEGRMNREKVVEIKNYDLAGGLLSATNYAYKADGAISFTTTRDESGNILSDSRYEGRMSREKVSETRNYDQAGAFLTSTVCRYKADGALGSTVTYDENGNKLSETTHEGKQNREKTSGVMNYDLAGDLLTVTTYAYKADGAINVTVTLDNSGKILSESAYAGRMNREKVYEAKSYDAGGALLATTIYAYKNDGAMASTVTNDDNGKKLSENVYEGRMGREKTSEAKSYDLAGALLTVTTYSYKADGATDRTVSRDEAGKIFSETSYEGRMNRERSREARGYDLDEKLLTVTVYAYRADGAIESTTTRNESGDLVSQSLYVGRMNREKTREARNYDLAGALLASTIFSYKPDGATDTSLTSDAAGNKLSESVYEGRMNREKVKEVKNFDLAGALLTLTTNTYKADGAMAASVTRDESGRELSENIFFGRMNCERVSESRGYDSAGKLLTSTAYLYGIDGAMTSTVTSDETGVELSRTVYEGRQSRERVSRVTSYDIVGELLSTTTYAYKDDGSMSGTATRDENGKITSDTTYAGRMNREKVVRSKGYDLAEALLSTTSYEYKADGAMDSTVTRDENGKIISGSAYYGRMNREKVSEVKSYDLDEKLLTVTVYSYGEGGATASTSTGDETGRLLSYTLYEGRMGRERVLGMTSYDLAGKISNNVSYAYKSNGAIDHTVTSGADHKTLSESIYEGRVGRERVSEVKGYDLSGGLLSATVYSYKADGAIEITVTNDENGGKLSETDYKGRMGREKAEKARSYDLAGDLLAGTVYFYGSDGAVKKTVMSDEAGNKLSESSYEGRVSRERVTDVKCYDLAGALLTNTAYAYNADGSMQYVLTSDDKGDPLSRNEYEGSAGRERVALVKAYDLAGQVLSFSSYKYGDDGAITSTALSDEKNNKLSETAYTGRMGRERVSCVKSYDLEGTLLSTTAYTYVASGAISSTITYGDNAEKTLETSYDGRMGRERVRASTSFDRLGGVLTQAAYVYSASGAMIKTQTSGFSDEARKNWKMLFETLYEGRTGRERVTLSTSFDLAGGILSSTNYVYNASGAIAKTRTEGFADAARTSWKLFSEDTYEGRMGRERSLRASSYDLAGALLSASSYEYSASGALFKVISYSYDGITKVSESTYAGLKDKEKVSSAVSFDLSGKRLNTTNYEYDNVTGCLKSTVTKDFVGIPVSRTEYSGLMNREKSSRTISYSADGAFAENVTSYEYDTATGSLSKAVTYKASNGADGSVTAGRKLSQAEYFGLTGREKNHLAISYDTAGDIKYYTDYVYAASGALTKTLTRDKEDINSPAVSETFYVGRDGYEVSDFILNYKDDAGHTVKTSSYYFYESFKGFSGGAAVYETGRASGAFREDAMKRSESYVGGGIAGSTAGLTLESIAYYTGAKNKETIEFSQSWGLKPGSDTERYLRSTTLYEYDSARAMRVSYSYQEGTKGSKDVTGLKHLNLSKYRGDRGEEKLSYMEGSTCAYNLADYDEWDYYVRTDFEYDSKDRNTGYFEKTFTPQGKWDWTNGAEGTFVSAQRVKLSDFDDKDRYGKMDKVLYDRAADGSYAVTGERYLQENFVYNSDDNVTHYRETHTDKKGDVKRYELSFENFIEKDRATKITTWELNEDYQRNGDFSEKSAITYYDWGQVKSYTLTSSTDSKKRVSNIFDIHYSKDLVTWDKMTSPDDIIYFDSVQNYTLREYKYDTKKELQTTTNTNGDSVSVSDKDGRLIYFEWTEEMVSYREKDFVSKAEPEGAGPRAGSITPSNPGLDMLEEARKRAAYTDVIAGRDTAVTYTSGGEVSCITDIKGNIYRYSGNRLAELKDSDGNVRASVTYEETDGVLTESMRSLVDDAAAVYKYDSDRRKLSANVTDASGAMSLEETYAYTYSSDTKKKVVLATIHREFSEAGSVTTVDKIEKYDSEERLTDVYTRSQNSASKSFVSYWQALSFSADDKLTSCRDIRFDSPSFGFEQFTAASGITMNDEAFRHIASYKTTGDPGLTPDEILIYGKNDVLISDETWNAAYRADGNIDKTVKGKKTFKYAPVTNVLAWGETSHSCKVNGVVYESTPGTDFYNTHDNGANCLDTSFSRSLSTGNNSEYAIYSQHIFNGTFDLSQIYLNGVISISTSAGASANQAWCDAYVKVLRGGVWTIVDDPLLLPTPGTVYCEGNRSPIGTTFDNYVSVDLKGVEGIELYAYIKVYHHADDANGGSENASLNLYDLEAITKDTNHYTYGKLSDTSVEFNAGNYDSKKNVLNYVENKTESMAWLSGNGVGMYGNTALHTETTWRAGYDDGGTWKGGYDVDRAATYTQVVHKTGYVDVTETTVRKATDFQNGEIIGYKEKFSTTAASGKLTERVVSDISYAYGKVTSTTETTHETGPGLNTTVKNIRSNMVYDARGNLSSWKDTSTQDVSQYSITPALRALWQDPATGLKNIFPSIDGTGTGNWQGKTIKNWAIETGYKIYDQIRDYAPSQKTTTNTVHDSSGRLLAFTEVERFFKDVSAGSTRQEQERTTQRSQTVYKNPEQIKGLTGRTKIIKVEDNSVIKDEPESTSGITYNSLGQQYSYCSNVNGQASRVDSSEYNILGQLARQYTRLDEYSYNETFYQYDIAGYISQTVNHYYYEKQTTEEQGKDTVTITQHHEETTTYDKYGEKTSENIIEYTNVDVKKSFWTDTFGQYLLKGISLILGCIPGVGWAVSLAFNNIVAVIQGTFSWMSFAVQLACVAVKFAIQNVAEGMGLVDNVSNSNTNLFDADYCKDFMSNFTNNLAQAVVTTTVSEGICAVGRSNGWNTYLTSAVASFASAAVGYGMGGFSGDTAGERLFNFTSFASEAMVMGAIDKYVEDNPSDWANILAPIAKSALGQAYSILRSSRSYAGLLGQRQKFAIGFGKAVYSQWISDPDTSMRMREAGKENISEKDFIRSADKFITLEKFVEWKQGKLSLDAMSKGIISDVLNTNRDNSAFGNMALSENFNLAKYLSNDSGKKYEGLACNLDMLIMGTAKVSDLRGEGAKIPKMAGAEKVTIMYDVKTGKEYYRFSVINDVEPIIQAIASPVAKETYRNNLDLSRNKSLEMVVSSDGKEAYLLGDASFKELKGAAKSWAALAGYGENDKVQFEFNLKSGDLFMFMDVKNAQAFLSAENAAKNREVSELKQTLTDGVGSIDKIKKLEIAVRINDREAKTGEIVKATFTVAPSDITNKALADRVKAFLNKNFNGLRSSGLDVVLSVEPKKGSDVNIEGLSLDLSKTSVSHTVNSLKEQTPELQKLAIEIDTLVKLANGDPKNFDRITLKVNDKGGYSMDVRIKSEVLKGLPNLMSKLGIIGGSEEFDRLGRREFTNFIIDVKSGSYLLDLSLRCREFENILPDVGDTRTTAVDSKGRAVRQEVYDTAGGLIVTREFAYADANPDLFKNSAIGGNVMLTEKFNALRADGSPVELHRISIGSMEKDTFVPTFASFEPLDTFEGCKFNYIVGDSLVSLTVTARVGDVTGKNFAIVGELQASQMGLATTFSEGGASYDAYTVGVELKSIALVVYDDKLLTVNGEDRQGAAFFSTGADGSVNVMFLYNGSAINVEGSKLMVESGEAFFGAIDTISVPGDVAVQPPADPAPDARALTEGTIAPVADRPLGALERLDNFFTPIAGASGMSGSVRFRENRFTEGPGGEIMPVEGVYGIFNNKVLAEEEKVLETGKDTALGAINKWIDTADDYDAFDKGVFKFGDKVAIGIDKAHELGGKNAFAALVMKNMASTMSMYGIGDLSTTEGYLSAYLSLGCVEMMTAKGCKTAVGLGMAAVIVAKAIANPRESLKAQKLLGITKEAWNSMVNDVKRVLKTAKSIGGARDLKSRAIVMREIGRQIGAIVWTYYIGKGIKADIFQKGGRVNGILGGGVRGFKEGVVKRSIGVQSKIKSALGERLYGSCVRKIQAVHGIVERVAGKVREVYRRMGDAYRTAKDRILRNNSKGNGEFTARIGKERSGIGKERSGIGKERSGFGLFGSGLLFLEKKVKEAPKKIWDAHVSKRTGEYLSGVTKRVEGSGAGAGILDRARKGAWGAGDLGRIGLVGVAPYIVGAKSIELLANDPRVRDFFAPNFNDPSSFGAAFWTGVRDHVSSGYETVKTAAVATAKTIYDTFDFPKAKGEELGMAAGEWAADKMENINTARLNYDNTDTFGTTSTNAFTLFLNETNKDIAAVAKGFGLNAIADFVRPDYTDENSFGAKVWTGTYENISAGYEFAKDAITDAAKTTLQTFEFPRKTGESLGQAAGQAVGEWFADKFNNIGTALNAYNTNDTLNQTSTNAFTLFLNETNKDIAAVAKGFGFDAIADFVRPDYTDENSIGAAFWDRGYTETRPSNHSRSWEYTHSISRRESLLQPGVVPEVVGGRTMFKMSDGRYRDYVSSECYLEYKEGFAGSLGDPVKVRFDGFELEGELTRTDLPFTLKRFDPVDGWRCVKNGTLSYGLDSTSIVTFTFRDSKAVEIAYHGTSQLARLEATRDPLTGTILSGTLYLKEPTGTEGAIIFANGRVVLDCGDPSDPAHVIISPNTGEVMSLLGGVIAGNGLVSGCGLNNPTLTGVSEGFEMYVHQDVIDTHNILFPDEPIKKNATVSAFNGSDMHGGPIGRVRFVGDILSVGSNEVLYTNQLTNYRREDTDNNFIMKEFSTPTEYRYSAFNMLSESGDFTACTRQINYDMPRVPSVVCVSSNMHDKISNPFVRFVTRFSSVTEWPNARDLYTKENTFLYPDKNQTVVNIVFQDGSIPDPNKNGKSYDHVAYARFPNHPMHDFYVVAAACALHARYDGGAALKAFLRQAEEGKGGVVDKGLKNTNTFNKQWIRMTEGYTVRGFLGITYTKVDPFNVTMEKVHNVQDIIDKVKKER